MAQAKQIITRKPRQQVLSDFVKWLKVNPYYNEIWEGLTVSAKSICHSAIIEMRSITPIGYISWWTIQHMRFIGVRGAEQRKVNEIMQTWTCAEIYANEKRKKVEQRTGSIRIDATESAGDETTETRKAVH